MEAFIQKAGSTRCVLICADLAIKIAMNEEGRLNNRKEAKIWKDWCDEPDHPNTRMLCPVLWSGDPEGHVIVMAKATTLESECHLPDWDYIPGRKNIRCELKPENWGRYQGRIVVVDYAFVDTD